LTVTADGIDGTKNLPLKKECGPIITIAHGLFPKYKDCLASGIGLIVEGAIFVADPQAKVAYKVQGDDLVAFTTPTFEPSTARMLFDDYTTVAKKRNSRNQSAGMRMTDSTAWTIILVAFKGYGLMLDGTDKYNFEMHAMYCFAIACGLILNTFGHHTDIGNKRLLGWNMNPDPASPDQAAFYFVPNKAFEAKALKMFG